MDEFLRNFLNPPKEYRAVPFWSWNDKLDPEFLRWQIREMDKAGLGGYFMHARGGLETPYLSEEWMKCIEACIDEGNKHGMSSWCYDEEGWPSGFAGGIITAMGDYYHVRWLELEEVTAGNLTNVENVLCTCGLSDDNKLYNVDNPNNLPHEQKLLTVRHNSNPYYVDVLNEKVIKAFLDSTYEKYYERFKDDFGKGMPGFFTDEPQFSKSKIPWSYILPERFENKFGYDIKKVLPALFIQCEGYQKIRYDFWSLVNELYVTSFGKQIFDWCNEHNCKLTGHVMMEDSLAAQMQATAGCMPFYEYMHTPGIDWLGRKISSPLIPKQVGSAACQMGKKFVLSETFALCGWDVSLEELKWIAEWQYVNGVNFMCQHLEGYTLRGLRKRDYPPSLFYQQSWWEEYKQFNDYFARLGVLLTSGKNAADVLLLHPIKSGWITYNGRGNNEINKLDSDLVWATETLSGLHVDHHYGDETLIAKHGSVDGKEFIVGQCKYNAVIIPSMVTIDEKTASLLYKFAENGGLIISIGEFPLLINGTESDALLELKNKVHLIGSDTSSLSSLIKKYKSTIVSISDKNGQISAIRYQLRDLGSRRILFMVNQSRTDNYNAKLEVDGKWKARKFVAETGDIKDINFENNYEGTALSLDFLPMQSHVIVFDREEDKREAHKNSDCIKVKPSDEWNIVKMDVNSLTLDICSYSIDNGIWEGPVPVIKLMDILLSHKRECNIALKFNFEVNMDLNENEEFKLVLETPEKFDISVNGTNVIYSDIGWWKDSTFKKVDIKQLIKNGTNEVILKCKFSQRQKVYDVLFGENVLETERNKLTYDTELESIYIIGDFGVKSLSQYTYGERKAVFTEGPFIITDKPKNLKCGNFSEQGLNFFAGKITICQSIEVKKSGNDRVILDLGRPNAAMSKIYINGIYAGTLLWEPFSLDITEFTNNGHNKLEIELYSSNRNLLGPHHHADGELYGVGPLSFTDKRGWVDNFKENIWMDRYCFVKFGIGN